MKNNYVCNPVCQSCKIKLSSHYARFCKPCNGQLKSKPLTERLEKFIDKSGNCWNWIGAKDPKGYGRLYNKNGPKLAHRLYWQLKNGELPEGISLCHHCDNPSCVRPSHMFPGTQKENSLDATLKGRNNKVRKLTEDDIKKIRSMYKFRKHGFGERSLAKLFGVTSNAIRCILKRETWSHIQ